MLWVDLFGYAASATVLATFCMSTMIPLRILALVSNVLFSVYGYFNHPYPVLIPPDLISGECLPAYTEAGNAPT